MKNLLLFTVLVIGAHSSYGASCLGSDGRPVPVENAQVLKYKSTVPNTQVVSATHVQGTITNVYPDRNGHNHFAITLTGKEIASDELEVVYNFSFGDLPTLVPGMSVEACGDYITSNADAVYPASPVGAIIHWIHRSESIKHLSGFLMINGTEYGQGNGFGS